jgi:hypothetical protein
MINKIDLIPIIIIFTIVIVFLYFKIRNDRKLNNEKLNNKVNKLLEETTINKENNQEVEKFIVADAREIHQYEQLRDTVKQLPDDFTNDRLNHPDTEDKVDYDKKNKENDFSIQVIHGEPTEANVQQNEKSYINTLDFGWDAPFPVVGCANSSIEKRYKTGPQKTLPYEVACGFPNKITAENFYKTHYLGRTIPLEDYAVRGANYADYSDSVIPTKLNVRILSQNTKGLPPSETKYKNIPVGYNYGFHNTPAMRLP